MLKSSRQGLALGLAFFQKSQPRQKKTLKKAFN
jgi:hypothetical protein